MKVNILPEFQEFLSSRQLVKKNYIPFFASWASKYLSFSIENRDLIHNLRVQKFLDKLKSQNNCSDWQIRQAHDAIRLYYDHFRVSESVDISNNNTFLIQKPMDIQILTDKMRQSIRIRHYSYRTEHTYILWVSKFLKYIIAANTHNRSAGSIESADVRNYLSYLALKKRVSASTQNQAFNAILFFCRYVLLKELNNLGTTVRAKRVQRLPVVLSVEEVQSLFKSAQGLSRLILKLIYGAGLRLMELVRLRVKDVDFGSNLIFIRDGKGNKDRATILPESIKSELKHHMSSIKKLHEKYLASGNGDVYLPYALERKYPNAAKEWKWQYVFPASKLSVDPVNGKVRRHHISEKKIQRAVKDAAEKSGINKHIKVHTLRHSFATHLLMNGVNIREIQELLGHKNVETTMIYTHVLRDISKVPKSPLDNL